jgi:hypothetical protein
MLIFQRRTVIGRSKVLSRISFNKPAPTRLVAEKRTAETVFWQIETAQAPLIHCFEVGPHAYAVAGTGKLRKRKPKMIPKAPNTIA